MTRSRRGQPASHEEAVSKSRNVNAESQRPEVCHLLGHTAGVGVEVLVWKRVEYGLQQW